MTRILVDYGALVDAVNGAGQTPLHIAAAEGDEPLVKYFYGVRANAAIADNEGNFIKTSNKNICIRKIDFVPLFSDFQ